MHAWAHWIARATGAAFGVLTEAANTVGGHLVEPEPPAGAPALTRIEMIERPRSAYLLWNLELDYDTATIRRRPRKLYRRPTPVIAFSNYRNGAIDYADVILPITPFTGDRRLVRQLRRLYAEFQWHGASGQGKHVRMEGAAGAGQHAGLGRRSDLTKQRSRSGPTRCRRISLAAWSQMRLRRSPAPQRPATSGYRGGKNCRRSDLLQRSDRAPLGAAAGDARCTAAEGTCQCTHSAGVRRECRRHGARISGRHVGIYEAVLDERIADGVVHVSAAHESTTTRSDVLPDYVGAPAMDAITAFRQSDARRCVARRMVADQDRCDRGSDPRHGCVSDAMGSVG